MNKKVLTEQLGKLDYIKESVEKHSNCLGKLKGICAECDKPTRNGRIYSKKLWEGVVNSDTFKEYKDTKTLFGELNHPADRLETDITKVAIALSDVEFKPDGTLIGTFDILNTPSGQILKSLCDYGSKLGVSSRGGGDIISDNGQDYVSEDSYDFVAFDVVALPAVKAARPTVIESIEYKEKVLPLKESLLKQIEVCDNKSQLNLIKSIIESINLPETDSVLITESINRKLDKVEGEVNTSNMLNDLNEAIQKTSKLEEEKTLLVEKISVGSTKEAKLQEELNKLKDVSKSLGEKANRVKALESALEVIKQKATEDIKSLKEEVRRLQNKSKTINESYYSNSREVKLLSERLNESSKNVKLFEGQLKEERQKNQKETDKQITIIENLKKDSLIKENILNKKLNESLNKNKELQDNTKKLLESYINLACKYKGLDKKEILNKLKENYTTTDIDLIIEEVQNYKYRINSLPFEVGEKLSATVITEDRPKKKDDGGYDFSNAEMMLRRLKK